MMSDCYEVFAVRCVSSSGKVVLQLEDVLDNAFSAAFRVMLAAPPGFFVDVVKVFFTFEEV